MGDNTGNQEQGRDAAWPGQGPPGPGLTPGGDFTLSDVISSTFAVYKENFLLFAGAAVIVVLATVATSKLAFVQLFFSEHLAVGIAIMALSVFRGRKINGLNELFQAFQAYLPVFLAGLLFLLAMAIGLMLLVVPGVYIAVAYGFVTPLLAEDVMEVVAGNKKPADIDWMGRLKQASELVDGYKIKVFLYSVVLGLMGLSGLLILGVGVVVTLPIVYIGYIDIYERIRKAKAGVPEPSVQSGS